MSQSTQFTVAGYEISAGATPTADGFSVRYDAPSGFYIFDLPAQQPGKFSGKEQNNLLVGKLVDASDAIASDDFRVLRPQQPWAFLTYSTFAFHSGAQGERAWLAFGMPTPASEVPRTGSASYEASFVGGDGGAYEITGNAILVFDFASGTLGGRLDASAILGADQDKPLTSSLGRYDFSDTIYSAGSTSFSGQLANANLSALGSFQGSFTGPNAQELVGRWQLPFARPSDGTISQAFGAFAGKKQP